MSDRQPRSPEEVEREMRQVGLGYERPLRVTLAEVQAQKQSRTGDKNVGRKPSSTHHHDHSLEQEKDIMSNVGSQTHESVKHQSSTNSATVDPITAAIEAKKILEDSFSVKREVLRVGATAVATVALGAAVLGVVSFFTKPVAVVPEAVPLKK